MGSGRFCQNHAVTGHPQATPLVAQLSADRNAIPKPPTATPTPPVSAALPTVTRSSAPMASPSQEAPAPSPLADAPPIAPYEPRTAPSLEMPKAVLQAAFWLGVGAPGPRFPK